MKNIMLVCAAGMSTSLVVNKMQEEAEKQNIEAKIWAVGESEVRNHYENADIILLGPQVRFLEKKIKEIVDGSLEIVVMNMQDYGMVNGAKIFNDTLALMEE